MNKFTKIALATAVMTTGSWNVVAQENLHAMGNAESYFQKYNSGQVSVDPFKAVVDNYKDRHADEFADVISPAFKEVGEMYRGDNGGNGILYIKGERADKAEAISDLYSTYDFESDADAASFSSHYEAIVEANKDDVQDTMAARRGYMKNALYQNADYVGSYTDSLNSDLNQAASNMVILAKSEFDARRSEIQALRAEKYAQLDGGYSDEATNLAGSYAGCGESCDLPVVPPPETGDDDTDSGCLYDSENFIRNIFAKADTGAGYAEWGRYEQWYVNNVKIYEAEGERAFVTYNGTTYTKGSWQENKTHSAKNAPYWEICEE